MENKMENVLQQNFVAIWHHFLFFEINRSKLGVETWGSGNAYLIFQVIAWHHILVMSDQAESKIRDEAVELWFQLTKTGFKTRSVLTYTLISSLTSLSIETVRRHVKMVHDGINYPCDQCYKNYRQKYTLQLHVKTIHANVAP